MRPMIKPTSGQRKRYKGVSEESTVTERLIAAEQARLEGAKGYTVDEFQRNMMDAVKKGAEIHEV